MNWKLWTSVFFLLPGVASAQTLRFATWNIENFWHVEGESLRGPHKGRDTIRYAEDYDHIREVIDRLDADVWALQEVGSPQSAAFLFPEDEWTLIFSRRYNPRAGRDIYTALAIAKDAAEVIRQRQIPLSVSGNNRDGTAALIDLGEQRVWVASVHMKSGCRDDDLDYSGRDACETWAEQLPILERWIDDRLDDGVLVGGDFNRTLMRERGGIDPAWLDLADGRPERLLSFPFTAEVNCPEGRFGSRTWPVEFILTNADWARQSAPGHYVQSMGGEELSDHCPVLVEFEF